MTTTWLIDTATGDLARPLAELALARGGRVVLTGSSPADLAELADLADDGARLVARERGDDDAATAAVRAAADERGLDVLVTATHRDTTGSTTRGTTRGTTGDPAARLRADVDPAVLLHSALPELRQGRGAVLHLTSLAGAGWLEAVHDELAALGIAATVAERDDQPADPRRLARVLADVVTGGHAPRRLVLGSAALHRTRQELLGRLQELDVWAGVSRSADPADAPVRLLDRGLAGVLHLAAPAA